MKKRSKLDLSSGLDQKKLQAAGFSCEIQADPAVATHDTENNEKNFVNANEELEKPPTEPQAENVQETAQQEIDLRRSQASYIIKKHVMFVMGASLVPIPLFDLVALTGVQLKMLHGLTKLYEVPFSKNFGKSAIASLLGGVMPTSTAMTLASLAKIVPGLGTATGIISVSLLGGATTYAIGSVFAHHFESGGTLLDFNTRKMRVFFSNKLEEGKGVAANLKLNKTEGSR